MHPIIHTSSASSSSCSRTIERPSFTEHRDILLQQREIGNQYRKNAIALRGYRKPQQLYTSMEMSDVKRIRLDYLLDYSDSLQLYGFSPDGKSFSYLERSVGIIHLCRYSGIGDVMEMGQTKSFDFRSFCNESNQISLSMSFNYDGITQFGFTEDSKTLVVAFEVTRRARDRDIVVQQNGIVHQLEVENAVLAELESNRRQLDSMPPAPQIPAPPVSDQQHRQFMERLNFPEPGENRFQDAFYNSQQERYRQEVREERISRGLDPDGAMEERGPDDPREEEERYPLALFDFDDFEEEVDVILYAIDIESGVKKHDLFVPKAKICKTAGTLLRKENIAIVHDNDDIVIFGIDEKQEFSVQKYLGSTHSRYALRDNATGTRGTWVPVSDTNYIPSKYRQLYEEKSFMSYLKQKIYRKAFSLYNPDRFELFMDHFGNDIEGFEMRKCLQAGEGLLLIVYERNGSISRDASRALRIKSSRFFFAVVRWEDATVLDVSHDFGDLFTKSQYWEIVEELFPNCMQNSKSLRKRLERATNGRKREVLYVDFFHTLLDRKSRGCLRSPFLDESVFKLNIDFEMEMIDLIDVDDTSTELTNVNTYFPLQVISARSKRVLFTAHHQIYTYENYSVGACFHPTEPVCIFLLGPKMYVGRPKRVFEDGEYQRKAVEEERGEDEGEEDEEEEERLMRESEDAMRRWIDMLDR